MEEIKKGIRQDKDNGGVAWKVFANEMAKVREEMDRNDINEIINESGFQYADSGPGGYFAHISNIRITRRKILVCLRFGLDI